MTTFLNYVWVAFFVAGVISLPAPEGHTDDSSLYCEYKGIRIKEGETDAAPVGECGTLKCENATTGLSSGVGCGTFDIQVVIPGPICRIVEGDKNKRYPDCCSKVHCEGYYPQPTIHLSEDAV